MTIWLMRIKRGSTLRVPLTMTDTRGTPVEFLSAVFTLQPDSGSAIQLTQANGKLIKSTWNWTGSWSEETDYVIGDVVESGGELFRAVQANTNVRPHGSNSWEIFAQFTILVGTLETATYSWESGSYKLDVTYANADFEEGYIKGRVKVTDD